MQSKQLTVNSSQSTVRKGFSTVFVIALVAVIGVVAVLAFGVFDVSKIKKTGEMPEQQVDQQIKDLDNLSPSDELPDIEKDLNATNLEEVDSELDQIDKDLGSL